MRGDLIIIGIICITLLVFIFPVSYGINQSECETGNGVWRPFKRNSVSDDPTSPQNEKSEGYCSCSEGWDWDDILKKCVDNLKEKCENTEGVWQDGTCLCPENNIYGHLLRGYDPRFGCGYDDITLEKESSLNRFLENKLVLAFLGFFIVLVFAGINRWKKK